MASLAKALIIAILLSLGLSLSSLTKPASASMDDGLGRETGLPLPRFVSLKKDMVNLRVGPGRKYAISWQYRRKGLPVEVIQEFDQWRRIRDSDGATGWVLHSLLSSRRTALIAPWQRKTNGDGSVIQASFLDGKESAGPGALTVARPQAGLLVDVERCEAGWCAVEAQGTDFWLPQKMLWGVYPGKPFRN